MFSTLEELEALLALLRDNKVSYFRSDETEIELYEVTTKPTAPDLDSFVAPSEVSEHAEDILYWSTK